MSPSSDAYRMADGPLLVVRPARPEDVADLLRLAEGAGTGLTTLPANPDALAERVDRSLASFARAAAGEAPTGTECFLLVLDDLTAGRVCGTAAVYLGVGEDQPFWNFRRSTHSHFCHELGIRVDSSVLMLANDYTGASEVGTLYLDPAARRPGVGALLARSRYLMMAVDPARFGSRVIAELRGWLDDSGQSPFWAAVGQHFFQMSFDRADLLSGTGQTAFIADLMPRFPIYADLLPAAARAAIGVAQQASEPALHLLLKEGFRHSHSVDIFDAGPVLEAHPRDLRAVRDSRMATLLPPEPGATPSCTMGPLLVCIPDYGRYRVVMTPGCPDGDGGLAVPRATLTALAAEPGDPVRWCPL